jgi:rRNA-processing protein FCF1
VTTDTIVDEVRAIRDAIAREHDYDLASICRALREEARAAGIHTVSLPSRPVSRVTSETAAEPTVAADGSGTYGPGSRR